MGLMRIAMIGSRSYPAAHGGIEVAVEELSAALAEMGHLVTVFSDIKSSSPSSDINIDVRSTTAIRTKYTHTASLVMLNLLTMQPRDFDIVHIHGVGPAFPLMVTPNAYKATPTVATIHGIDWEREKWPNLARRFFKKISTRALTNAGALTAVSRPDAEQVEKLIGIPVAHIRNGAPPLFRPIDHGKRDKYSIYVGRLTPEKNVDGLIREYDREVADKLGPLHIIGGGGSSYSSRYEKELRNSAPPWVHFEGPKSHEETLARLAKAGRYISLSKLEGQPLTVIEALTLQTPVFLSDIPAHRDLCGSTGNYVPVGSAGALRQLLLAGEPLQRGDRSPVYQWTWRDAACQYLEIYQYVANLSR